jgi:hypothetical protein
LFHTYIHTLTKPRFLLYDWLTRISKPTSLKTLTHTNTHTPRKLPPWFHTYIHTLTKPRFLLYDWLTRISKPMSTNIRGAAASVSKLPLAKPCSKEGDRGDELSEEFKFYTGESTAIRVYTLQRRNNRGNNRREHWPSTQLCEYPHREAYGSKGV